MSHPNTVAAIISGVAAGLPIKLLHAALHVDLSLADATIITGGVIAAVLFVGRYGIKPALERVWDGAGKAWGDKPKRRKSKRAKAA